MRELRIFGINAVKEALLSGQDIKAIYLNKKEKPQFREIIEYSKSKGISVVEKADFRSIEGLQGKVHQNIIAFLEKKEVYSSIDLFFRKNTTNPPYLFVILDSVSDPRNLGAIIRSCEHFGANALVLPKKKACGINDLVYKTSSGALNYLPLIQVNNIARSIEDLKKRDFWVYGLDITTSNLIYRQKLVGNIAFVLGSEGKGIRRLIRASCDTLLRIESFGNISSLNVSVAAGVCLYELARQRLLLKKEK